MSTIEKTEISTLMSKAFGEYSKSIIQDRAIPDARDGLKPVQRRIICAMNEDGNTFDKAYKKSISGVANTMKHYHPHGDASIYDAMIRMGQWWKNNLKLVDVQGNEGSIDGDGPAASRYVEARLDKNANFLTEDLKYNTVLKVPNFDDTILEPTVLPSQIPLLLINGSTGIAAGYATSIPPFNFNEVINACIYRLTHKKMTDNDLISIIPAPDFPTGGYILGSAKHAVSSGKGKVVNSCTYEIKNGKKNNQMIITEIPFDVPKFDLVKEALSLNTDFIEDVRDESDKDGIRIVIDINKNYDVKSAVKYILKNTNFSKNYSFNMVAIIDKKPQQAGVLDLINAWCEFRKDVIKKKFEYLLSQYLNKKEITDGLIRAYSILDDVVNTIKKSKDKADVIKNLQNNFKFTENQAIAIAEMRLYRLCNTDIVSLQAEIIELDKKIKEAQKIISSEKEIVKHIVKELERINKENVFPRKTKLISEEKTFSVDETKLIQNEDSYVVVTKDGYFKKMPLKKKDEQQFLKEDDEIVYSGIVNSHDYVKVFTNLGGCFKIQTYKIPECKSSELGTHISKWVKCDKHKIICVGNDEMLAWSKNGMIKRIKDDFEETGKKLVNIPVYFKLKTNDEVIGCEPISKTHILTLTENNINLYPIDEITDTSLTSGGLQACKIKDGDSLLLIKQVNVPEKVFVTKKNINTSSLNMTHRGYIGQKY